ncbi:hypothetical protein [Guptibacillus hwajinpoensis]|uniref:Uncharacterized protein n=1 Tax=Guptibacillus hwajinpoensis TaxID=208199 RepID=A0A0J6D216_9BACL|nr:hypothetical protein [Alkalihalobacillus macyae]KMM39343.1 hypothetical protein AB986_09080 [Alkalihalobacillus macyae]
MDMNETLYTLDLLEELLNMCTKKRVGLNTYFSPVFEERFYEALNYYAKQGIIDRIVIIVEIVF